MKEEVSSMEAQSIPDLNLFMMCVRPDPAAEAALPSGLSFDLCRPEELEIWKAFPFDDPEQARQYQGWMTRYFEEVYAPRRTLFFERCLFVRTSDGVPVATCFLWPAYSGQILTLHWFKVRKDWEGKGIGRALLTRTLQQRGAQQTPIYLHTQPSSYRAIKLYTDFGFALLTDPVVGSRPNHLEQSLPILRQWMPAEAYRRLRFAAAPAGFLAAVASSPIVQF